MSLGGGGATEGFMPLYIGFSTNAAKERIVSIMKLQKMTVLTAAISVILVAGAVSAFAEQSSGAVSGVQPDSGAAQMSAMETGDSSGPDVAAASSDGSGALTDFNYDALKDYVAYGNV